MKQSVAKRFMKQLKWNTIVLDRKTLIWQLFSSNVYNCMSVAATVVSDVSADVGVRPSAIQILLTNIHVALVKSNVPIML